MWCVRRFLTFGSTGTRRLSSEKYLGHTTLAGRGFWRIQVILTLDHNDLRLVAWKYFIFVLVAHSPIVKAKNKLVNLQKRAIRMPSSVGSPIILKTPPEISSWTPRFPGEILKTVLRSSMIKVRAIKENKGISRPKTLAAHQ